MQLPDIHRAIEQKSWEANIGEVYNRRSRLPEYKAMIVAQEVELAQRY